MREPRPAARDWKGAKAATNEVQEGMPSPSR